MPKIDVQGVTNKHLAIVALVAGLKYTNSSQVSQLLSIPKIQADKILNDLETVGIVYESNGDFHLRISVLNSPIEEARLHISYRDYFALGMSLLIGKILVNKLAEALGDTLLETLVWFSKAGIMGWMSFEIEAHADQLLVSVEHFYSLGFSKWVDLLTKMKPCRHFFFVSSLANSPLLKKGTAQEYRPVKKSS